MAETLALEEEIAEEEIAEEVAPASANPIVVAAETAIVEVETTDVEAELVEVVSDEPIDTDAAEEVAVIAARNVDVPLEAAADDLTKIKGIGKVYAQRLNAAGITTYARLIDTDVAVLEEVTKAIPAANAHDWARQARELT